MPTDAHTRIVRDPLWNTIRLDPAAVRIIDTPAFQRLRYIRQLGFAHLVYPGATHTRFDHALGVYHLTKTALRLLRSRAESDPSVVLPESVWDDAGLVPYAALLHDIGHYAFSHALEELETDRLPGDHEAVSAQFFESPELADALAPLGADAPETIHRLIRGVGESPLRGLVSGGLDLDKMEYLKRDALFCGVPYGEVDVDRMIRSLAIVADPETGALELGVQEKGVSALESLLFAKYQMFRNVYWHHGVRSATALYKRIVEEAFDTGLIETADLVGPTDEELLYEIGRRARDRDDRRARTLGERWLPALRNRQLPKRALELRAEELKGSGLSDDMLVDGPQKRALEDRLAAELELEPGEVFIDLPRKTEMFQMNVLVERRSGRVQRLGREGLEGLINLPILTSELYRTARVLRVFTFEPREISPDRILQTTSDVRS